MNKGFIYMHVKMVILNRKDRINSRAISARSC